MKLFLKTPITVSQSPQRPLSPELHVSLCIIGDANLDHLVKGVPASILQVELYFSPCNYKISWREIL